MKPFTTFPCKCSHFVITALVLLLLMSACDSPGIQDDSSINANYPLTEPSVGLEGLQSYHAVYELTLQGTLDGEAVERRSRIEKTFISSSYDEEILWQELQTGSEEIFLHIFRFGNAVYTLNLDEQDCWGEYVDQPEKSVPYPYDLLPPITRASPKGNETVSGVQSLHYHFGKEGLSLDVDDTSGEVWIAQNGGYVVNIYSEHPSACQPDW